MTLFVKSKQGDDALLTTTIGGKVVEVDDSERQPCEIWTRVMGYYRRVEDFNIGKKAEHAERKFFNEQKTMVHV